MEISTMMQDLKQQMEHLQTDTEMVEQLATKYREQLESAEKFIKESREQISYMQMTIDSMSVLVNMIGNKSESKPEIHESKPEIRESKPESKEKPPKPKVRPVYSRKPKAILRLDAHGNQVGYYRSVNECAKVLGWTNTGVTKTIEHISPEQQIRLKGFVLKYSA